MLAPITDHRAWLLDRFVAVRGRNARWSLRAFAGKLGISHSALSEILSGKRPLTAKMARRLAEKLKLSEIETQAFVRSAVLSKAQSQLPDDAQVNQASDGGYRPLDLDAFAVIADWYHYAILCLAELPGASWEPGAIAKRFRLDRSEVKAALGRLEKLGFLAKAQRAYRAATKQLSVYSEGYEPALRGFLHQHLAKAGWALDYVPAAERELSVTTLAIDPDKLPQAREAVKRFRRELAALLESGPRTRVYSLAVQLFPLDESPVR